MHQKTLRDKYLEQGSPTIYPREITWKRVHQQSLREKKLGTECTKKLSERKNLEQGAPTNSLRERTWNRVHQHNSLKDSVTRFLTTLLLKRFDLAPYEQGKRFRELFRFRKNIREKHVFALSTTTWTSCQRSQRLR